MKLKKKLQWEYKEHYYNVLFNLKEDIKANDTKEDIIQKIDDLMLCYKKENRE